jgi:hypothetical protein
MKTLASFATAAVATLFLAASCSGNADNAAATELALACDRYSEVFCDKALTCTPGFDLYIGDAGFCRERFAKSCKAAMALDGVTTTAADLDTCAAVIEQASCPDQWQALLTQCVPLFKGSKPDGAPCANGIQCQAGHCDRSGEEACGVCETRPGEGAPCPEGECEYGLICLSGSCTEIAVGAEGEGCNFSQGSTCQSHLACVDATCVVRQAEGGPCESALECQLDLVCDPAAGTCQPGPPPAAIGQACGTDEATGAYVICAHDGYCDAGVCQAKVADGGSCTSGSQCLLAADCVAGSCSIEPPTCP